MPKKKRRKKHKKRTPKIAMGLCLVAGAAIILTVLLWPHGPRAGNGGKTSGVPGTEELGEGTLSATLFHSCHIEGRLAPYTCEEGALGGVARMATMFRKWSEEVGERILVDVGNSTVVRHKAADTINAFTFSAFDQLGYDVVNCGQNEAGLDLRALRELAKDRKLKLISANLVRADDRTTVFPSHHVVRHRGQKIGLIGILREDIPSSRLGKGLRLISPGAALKSAVSALKGKADIIVALAFLPVEEIHELAKRHPEVNIFLGGATPVSSPPYEIAGRRTKPTAIISYLGDQGCTVGRLRTLFRKDQLPTASATVALLSEEVEPAPALSSLISEFTAALSGQALPGARQNPKMPCTSSYVGSEVCKLCHIKQYYSWVDTKHPGAYATLLQQGKHEDRQCLGCHTTGHNMPGGYDPDKPIVVRSKLEEEAERKAQEEKEKEKKEGADTEEPEPKESEKQPKGQPSQRPLQGVGCECCHGGARHHLGVALKDRMTTARNPVLRSESALRNCLRCHHTQRPCHNPEAADPYDRNEYMDKIKHWE